VSPVSTVCGRPHSTPLPLPAVPSQQAQFTCPKGHLSKTYRHMVRVRVMIRVRVRFSVIFLNLHNSISDK